MKTLKRPNYKVWISKMQASTIVVWHFIHCITWIIDTNKEATLDHSALKKNNLHWNWKWRGEYLYFPWKANNYVLYSSKVKPWRDIKDKVIIHYAIQYLHSMYNRGPLHTSWSQNNMWQKCESQRFSHLMNGVIQENNSGHTS